MENKDKPKIKGVLLDIEKNAADVVEFVPTLEEYYRMLHCDCIDIVSRKIGVKDGRVFDIVCDDEGLFREENKISAINDMGEAMLVGSLLLLNRGENGEEASLTDDDARFILSNIQKMCTRNHPEGYLMLTQCELC